MNILFIGPYRQKDGWGYSARDYIKSLLTTDSNVCSRPIYLTDSKDLLKTSELSDDIVSCENNGCDKYDAVIQYVLPNFYVKASIPSYLITKFETSGIENTSWLPHIKIADGVLVTSNRERETLLSAGVDAERIKEIGEAVDTSVFEGDHKSLDYIPSHSFNFYYIGDFIERKNLAALLLAFHSEFHYSENVNLILKLSSTSASAHNEVSNFISQVKARARINMYSNLYKSEIIVLGHISDEDLYGIHRSCDCFVMPSRGEAPCRPLLDAIGFGNTPIVTANTTMADYVNENTGYVVRSNKTPVFTKDSYVAAIYTPKESWQDIDIFELRKAMRQAYTGNADKIEKCKDSITRCSYSNVGANFMRALK